MHRHRLYLDRWQSRGQGTPSQVEQIMQLYTSCHNIYITTCYTAATSFLRPPKCRTTSFTNTSSRCLPLHGQPPQVITHIQVIDLIDSSCLLFMSTSTWCQMPCQSMLAHQYANNYCNLCTRACTYIQQGITDKLLSYKCSNYIGQVSSAHSDYSVYLCMHT